MKIGMNLLLWTGGVTAEHFPLLGKLKAAGFDGVELPVFGGTADDYKPIRAELDKLGLKCTTVTILTKDTNAISPDAATRQKAVEWLKTVVEINHVLGGDISPCLADPNVHVGPAATAARAARVEERRDTSIEADAGDVEEGAAGHQAGIDRARFTVERRGQRGARIAWRPQGGCQTIPRSRRDQREHSFGSDQAGARFVQRAVTAPHDYKIDIRRRARRRQIAGVSRAFGQMNLH